MNKKVIFIVIILIIVVFSVYQGFLKEKGSEYTLAEVVYGNVSQEVSETGQVQMGKAINLSFKNAGTIEKIYVQVGDKVWLGANLAKLNTSSLLIERHEAQASLEVAQAELNQLLEGATPEEIQVAKTTVDNAQIALTDAQQDFTEDLAQAYEDALNALDNAYLKGAGALATVTSIRKTYFYGNDQESLTVKARENNIDSLLSQVKEVIDNELVDTALTFMKNSLSDVADDLNIIRDMTEVANYANVVSTTNKTSLDTERLNINTALTSIVNAEQTITSTKITGQTSLNTAQGALKKAQDELTLKIAKPSQADIDLYQAQVKQAQAKNDLLDNQIWEATLRSPTQGQVIEINKRVGEMWQPSLTGAVMTLLPVSPYEIEVDIYEEDVVKVKLSDPVDIKMPAFPSQIFSGKVISIDPAEELVEGVVYYKVTVNFENPPQKTKPGMSADVTIKTAQKDGVLTIPGAAIEKKDDKVFVQILKDEKLEKIEIQIGLRGNDDMVEVVSGLTEGAQIASPK